MQKYLVTLHDRHGVPWALTRGAPGRSGVDLMGPVGLRTKVEVHTRSTTQQVGASPIGWVGDPMEATWRLGFHAEEDPLPEVHGLFDRGVSPLVDCLVDVTLPGKGTLQAPVRVDLGDVEKSPATPGLMGLVVDATVKSLQGCWLGMPVEYEGLSLVQNRGDLPVWPQVHWAGAGASVTAPGIGRVPLPNTGGRLAVLDTSPETASRVQVGGVDAPDLWRGMRGRFFPLPVEGFSHAEWRFDRCVGVVRSAHSTMWGW